MPRLTTIGDVFELSTPKGFAYIQYTHDDPGRPSLGQLVRVLPGLYSSRPDISRLVREQELYFTFYTLSQALKDRKVATISNEPIPEWAIPFPIMRRGGGLRHDGSSSSWLIGDGSKMATLEQIRSLARVEKLTPEQRKLSIGARLWPHEVMVSKLMQGWTPERDDELSAKAIAASAATVTHPQRSPESIEHYLYFANKANGEKAARRLRDKGWSATMRMGADQKNWLVLAKQPLPVDNVEEVRKELEQLADDLNGEYDGWGVAV